MKRVEEHNQKLREARKPPPKLDYERQLIKVVGAQSAKKKVGKGVPQLGDTSRPLSPLIVADQYGSNVGVVQRKSGEPTFSEMDSLENYFIDPWSAVLHDSKYWCWARVSTSGSS